MRIQEHAPSSANCTCPKIVLSLCFRISDGGSSTATPPSSSCSRLDPGPDDYPQPSSALYPRKNLATAGSGSSTKTPPGLSFPRLDRATADLTLSGGPSNATTPRPRRRPRLLALPRAREPRCVTLGLRPLPSRSRPCSPPNPVAAAAGPGTVSPGMP